MVESHDDPLLGTTIDGRYELLSVIGSGGMGVVYKASHQALEKLVAVKVLTELALENAVNVKRFQSEATALKELDHVNIVRIYGLGLLEGSKPFLALEYLDGGSLSDFLKKSPGLSIEACWKIAEQVTAGLAHAHSRKVLHRDIKPGNLMFARPPAEDENSWQIKIVDFGIAKFFDTPDRQKLTQTGSFLGTPLYMSPEQLNSGTQTAAGDVYSTGCVIYQCLFGSLPYDGDNVMEVALNQSTHEIQFPEKTRLGEAVPPALKALLIKTLETSSSKRIADGIQLAEWLQKVRAQPDVVPEELKQTAGRPRRLLNDPGRVKGIRVKATIASLAVGAAGIFLWTSFKEHARREDNAQTQRLIEKANGLIRDGSVEALTDCREVLKQIYSKPITQPDLQANAAATVVEFALKFGSRDVADAPTKDKLSAIQYAVEVTDKPSLADEHFRMMLHRVSVQFALYKETLDQKYLDDAERDFKLLTRAYDRVTNAMPRGTEELSTALSVMHSISYQHYLKYCKSTVRAEKAKYLERTKQSLESAVSLIEKLPDEFTAPIVASICQFYSEVICGEGNFAALRKLGYRLDTPSFRKKLGDAWMAPTFWIVLVNVAENKNYEESLALMLPICNTIKNASPKQPLATTHLYYLGALYRALNKPEDAIDAFTRSLAIAKEIKNSSAQCDAEFGISETYRTMGDFSTAQAHLDSMKRIAFAGKATLATRYRDAIAVQKRIQSRDTRYP